MNDNDYEICCCDPIFRPNTHFRILARIDANGMHLCEINNNEKERKREREGESERENDNERAQ